MTERVPSAGRTAVADLVMILAQTYPAWRITVVPSGLWFATRHRALTPEEKGRGVLYCLARPNGVELAAALAEQVAIMYRHAGG